MPLAFSLEPTAALRPELRLLSRGFTLAEMLIASGLATIVALGAMSLDMVRIRITTDLKARMNIFSGQGGTEMQAALAAAHIARTLEITDRYTLGAPDTFSFRVAIGCMNVPPVPGCYEQTTNYEWRQYKVVDHDGDGATPTPTPEVLAYRTSRFDAGFVDPGGSKWPCSAWTPLAGHINNPNRLTFNRRNKDGILPAANDNNIVEYGIHWNPPGPRERFFRGQITLRPAGNANQPSFELLGLPADDTIGIDATTVGDATRLGAPSCF